MDKIGNSTGHKLRLPLGIIDEIIFQRGAVQAVIRCSVYAVTHERNGINGNLGSFVTDVENSFRLAELLPPDAVKVSESGISNPDTVRALRDAGFNGFLIGENFMKTDFRPRRQ